MELDALDRAILDLLLEDARRSYRAIARRLDTTAPTVSARVQAMEELGVIRGYRAVLAPEPGPDEADREAPAEVNVPCHWCDGPIHGPPVKARFGGRLHVFCCRQCKASFGERHDRLGSTT